MNEQFQLALPVGTLLNDGSNQYEIIDPENGTGFLGQGGFGITYLAREKRLERDVAIKEFFPNEIVGRGQTLTVTSRDEEQFTSLKKYFLGEARFLARFNDPHIVKVLAFFEANNTAYMVMPFLRGDTVSDRYKKKPFTEAQAKDLLLQLMMGLKTVHANGVLHRDIKPDNIKFDSQTDTPILIDFGSARTSEVQGTKSTFGAYSPHFSPIELNSTNTRKTAATDVYALAATIYRTLFQSGPPDAAHRFEQDDDGLPELEMALAKGQISSEFSDVLKKCLELRAKDRFQTLDEVEVALGRGNSASHERETATPLPVPSRKWVYAVTGVIGAGVIGAAILFSGDGKMSLHDASRYGTPENVTALLEAGANIEAQDEDGETPLHHASRSDTPENVTALLEAGANIEARDKDGWTPLHSASRYGTPENVTALLEAGANIEAPDEHGRTPLHRASGLGTPENVTALLEAGANIQARTEDGLTPLHLASWKDTPETVRALLEAGANIEAPDKIGGTPLHHASFLSTPETVTALLAAGANIEARNINGYTPLHEASGLFGKPENVTALLEAGANIEARSNNGWTPLHEASNDSTPENVTALLAAGANPKARNEAGETPFDLAKNNDKLKGTDAYKQLRDAS